MTDEKNDYNENKYNGHSDIAFGQSIGPTQFHFNGTIVAVVASVIVII